MAVNTEALDIILRLQGVPTYVAGMQEASGANDEFAASSKRAGAMSNSSAAASERQAGAASLVGKAMKASGLLLAAAGVEGVRMAIKFEKQMELIHTQAGASQKEVESLKKSVLGLAGSVPQGPEELAMGLYHLESMGLRGAKAMQALKISAQGAAVGNAELESVTSALGGAYFVGMKGAGNFQHVMGVLNATVGVGNMRMQELVTSFGSGILPVAKLAHIQIQDVGAALATLNDIGYSASKGANQLGTALHFLFDPTTKAKKALAELGITQQMLVKEMEGPRGLGGALELIKKGLGHLSHPEALEKLGEILPGGRGKVLLVLMEQMERFERKRKEIEAHGGTFSESVKRTMEQPAVKIAKAWSGFQATLIRFGQAMMGPATAALVIFAKALSGVLGLLMAVTDHGKLLVPIVLGLAAAWLIYKGAVMASAIATAAMDIGETVALFVMLIPEVEGAAGAFALLGAAMDANPIGLIALAIAALAAAVALVTYFIVTHFTQVLNFLKKWGFIVAGLIGGPFLGLAVFVATHWSLVTGILSGAIKWIEKNWGKLGKILAWPFEWVWGKISWLFHQIEKGISDIMNAPSHVWHSLTSAAGGVFGDIGKAIGIPGLAAGGTMAQSGFALINETSSGETVWLPGGSTVQPSPASSLLNPRAHTPNPAPQEPAQQVFVEAYLQMPPGTGRGLFKLITKEVAIKKARS